MKHYEFTQKQSVLYILSLLQMGISVLKHYFIQNELHFLWQPIHKFLFYNLSDLLLKKFK